MLALRGHAQVDARDVAAVERREGLAADALDRLQLGRRQLRRALVGDVLLPLLLDLEVVDRPRVGLVLEQDLHRRQHARPAIAEQADGELAARDVLLDQRRLPVAVDELAHDRAQRLLVVDDRRRRADALRRALRVRLDDQRELQLGRQALAARSPSPGTRRSGSRAARARASTAPCRARSRAWPSPSRCTGCPSARTARARPPRGCGPRRPRRC